MATTILGNLWTTYLTGCTEPTVAMNGFMRGIGDYITTNVIFNVTFVGETYEGAPITLSGPVPIIGAATSSHVVKFNIPAKDGNGCYTDGASEWLSWITSVYTGIRLSLIGTGICIPTGSIPAFPTMITPTWTRDDLKSVHVANYDNPQGIILDTLANKIIGDLRKFYAISYPATTVDAVGVATITSLITP